MRPSFDFTGSHKLPPIGRIVLRRVRMALRTPFVTALGVEDEREFIIVEVHADGVIGYGEASVLSQPTYNEETAVTAWYVLKEFFIPRAFHKSLTIPSPLEIARRLRMFKGHSIAKTGLEGAVWDAVAKAEGHPLNVLLAKTLPSPVTLRPKIPAGVVTGLAPDTAAAAGKDFVRPWLDHIRGFLDEGYRRIKVKIAPDRDVKSLLTLREEFGDVALSVDANGAYHLKNSSALHRLDPLGLAYIEQPFAAPDIIDHASLQKTLQTPLALDESIFDRRQAEQALELDGARVINIKAGRLGGLTEALAVHEACYKREVPALVGGLLESGIGRAHNAALASLPAFTLPGDLSASHRYWQQDVVDPEFVLDSEGCITVPQGPGIGVDVDRDFLQHITVDKLTLQPPFS